MTVDDHFPCHNQGGPVFSYASDQSLWVMILEKAFAKLNGSYLALRGGYASEAFQDLTGCPTFLYDLKSATVLKTIENRDFWRLLIDYKR